ncbi:hypothetical protein [Streptomyces sp. LUP47B]|uniref:hypothetical protein n=1 Tax=Streptomyces sp. LUP47B TaxID=1890286 RepID=UPI00114CF4FF|nr:hypothetical protein [Streptomyces sp. LUP47B]
MTVSSRRGAVAERRQPPPCARSRVRSGIDTEWQLYGDVVRGHPALARCGEGADDLGALVRAIEMGREEPSSRAARRTGAAVPGNPAARTGTPGR